MGGRTTNRNPGSDRPIGSYSSLQDIEQELDTLERTIEALRQSLKGSREVSPAGDSDWQALTARAEEIMRRPKTWSGSTKRSDARELEAVRAEMRARTEVQNRKMAETQSASAQMRELTMRQKALSQRRAEILHQQGGSGGA